MTSPHARPLVGVPACVKTIDQMPFHTVGDKYVRALAVSAGALPLMFPSLEGEIDVEGLLARVDGLMMTGSPSNVHPTHYGRTPHAEAEPYDPWRDSITLPLIRAAIDQGVPLLCICRGFQELNVALGGTLHARVHELPGRMDHRRPQDPDFDVQYGPKHRVALKPGGAIARLAGAEEIEVNSLHWQGLDRVAERLAIEATAPDGTIEAVSVKDAPSFALAVQWHPEYKSWENPFSRKLFEAFGAACRGHMEAKLGGTAPARRRA